MRQNNSQLYPKKEIKTLLLRLNSYDLKSNFWIYFSLSKMICNNVPLTVQRPEHNAVSFLVQCLLSTYWKLLPFLESICFFFYDFITIEYLINLFNSKAASGSPLIIFIALMVLPTANWREWPWQCVKWALDVPSWL